MEKVTQYIECNAKINLFLEVINKRKDNYHNINSVFQEIDLADILTAKIRDDGKIKLKVDQKILPDNENNLVVKAAKMLQKECRCDKGMDFYLKKNIPIASGLGGGSSDACGAMKLCNKIWNLGLGVNKLVELSLKIGSDIAFFFYGGTALCQGRGEIVTQIKNVENKSYTLAISNIAVETAKAYQNIDLTSKRVEVEGFLEALQTKNEKKITSLAFNRFLLNIKKENSQIKEVIDIINSLHTSGYGLSGSGSAFWIMDSLDKIKKSRYYIDASKKINFIPVKAVIKN